MESVVALKERANELFKDGKLWEANSLYDQCLLNPDIEKDLRCIVHNNKSQVFLKLGDFENAIATATEALSINPADPKALFRRAQAHEKAGNLAKALNDSRRLIRLDPKNNTAQTLIRRLEQTVTNRVVTEDSLTGRINRMFDVVKPTKASIKDDKSSLSQAICNLTSLIVEHGPSAASYIWAHASFVALYDLLVQPNVDLTLGKAIHGLLSLTFEHHPDRCVLVLNRLTPQYFVDRIFSRKSEESLEACRFLNSVLEALTQLKAYHTAKQAAESGQTTVETAKVAKCAYPRFKLDPFVEQPVMEIIHHLFRVTNSFRLSAAVRDYILEILVRFVPSERGLNLSKRVIGVEGTLDRLLEIGGSAGTSAIANWRSRRGRTKAEKTKSGVIGTEKEGDAQCKAIFTDTRLATSANTRMTLACLLAKLWDDQNSDKARDVFNNLCSDFVLDLFSDPFLETKVEAASVIGTLFLGPYDLGSSILSRPGILEGLFMLTQCPNMLYQTIALDTIILATNKKEQCLNLVSKAVPMLRTLYKSENDGTKIRALVALCKFGAAGGSDISIQSLTDGSSASLLSACRRLLFGVDQAEPTVDEVTALPSKIRAKISESGELTLPSLEEDDGEESDEEDVTTNPSGPRKLRASGGKRAELRDPETVRWSIEGLAYLSLNAVIKQDIVNDADMLHTLFRVAALGMKECAFPLATVLLHLTDGMPQASIEPEMVELAKFAKQHVPKSHELDDAHCIAQRRRTLVQAGLAGALYQLTMTHTSTDGATAGGQLGLHELIARLYLATSEEVPHRGQMVQAGAVKALLDLALKDNTDAGKAVAAQALARLTITADPRVTFPGQRSLELIRPLLHLIGPDLDGLQNFEGLLALTNLASISDRHRHRIMAERGVPLIDHHLFEEHPMLIRGAVECIANMAQYHPFVVASGGKQPIDENELGMKLPYLSSSTERVKALVLYCCEFEDPLLVRAAIGALATMSYDSGICSRITGTPNWFDTLQTLVGFDDYSIQHRAAHLLSNLITQGEESFGEYICQSNMLEVLMSLSQLPDLDATSTAPLPEITVTMNPGITGVELRQRCHEDRKQTKICAMEALQKLQQWGLVQPRLPVARNAHA